MMDTLETLTRGDLGKLFLTKTKKEKNTIYLLEDDGKTHVDLLNTDISYRVIKRKPVMGMDWVMMHLPTRDEIYPCLKLNPQLGERSLQRTTMSVLKCLPILVDYVNDIGNNYLFSPLNRW